MAKLGRDRAGNVIQAIRPGTTTVQVFGDTSALISIAAPGSNPRMFRVVATAACHIAVGVSPVATVNDMYLPAEVVEFIWLVPKDNIAVIQNLIDGTLFVTEASP